MKNKYAGGILLLAIILISIGVYCGEAAEVLSKGIQLCLECVGIG